ncbi:MAG: ion transporter, partial [Spirochaetota bacterium]
VLGLTVDLRKLLIITGFAFDALFTIELVARLAVSGGKGKAGAYLAREGGLVDFFSSLPLLVLSSGPLLYMTFFAGEGGLVIAVGSFSFLKIVKIMRIVRTLRFVRVLKLFGKVKSPYVMTPRYVSGVLVMVIAANVAALVGFTYYENGAFLVPQAHKTRELVERYMSLDQEAPDPIPLVQGDESVLFVKYRDEVLHANIEQEEFSRRFLGSDYYTADIGGYLFFFTIKDAKTAYALVHLALFGAVLITVLLVTTLYRSSFNRHVAGVLGVMIRGFRSTGYSTPVRVPPGKAQYESYRLGEQYNRKWLPLKQRILEIKSGKR